MRNSGGETKQDQNKPWYKRAWAMTAAWLTGVALFVGLINGWFLLIKNVHGEKSSPDSVKVITVPVGNTSANEALDSCQMARKQLSETGVSWSTQSFVDALVDNDKKNIELFLKACMPLTTEKDGTSIVLYGLQPGVADREWKLNLFISSGFEVNSPLSDLKIMRSNSQSLPPQYATKLTPQGYAAWNRSFKGPLGLWLVTWMCYAGVRPDDEALIRILARSGDKFEGEKDFLDAMQPAWGNSESYKQARQIVYKYSGTTLGSAK